MFDFLSEKSTGFRIKLLQKTAQPNQRAAVFFVIIISSLNLPPNAYVGILKNKLSFAEGLFDSDLLPQVILYGVRF